MDRLPDAVGERLARGEQQDLLVQFDDSVILRQAEQLNKERGAAFDDGETLRFKEERYAALKRKVLSDLPAGGFEVLKDYPVLPMMLLRFRSLPALRALLAQPAVLGVHEQRRESPLPVVREP